MNDNTDTNWLLCGYNESGSTVDVVGQGTGGFDEYMQALTSHSDITYGGFRLFAVDDRGNTVSRRAKFVTVACVPAGTPVMKKARVGTHSGTVLQALHGGHVAKRIDGAEELSKVDLEGELLAAGGSHKPTSFDW